jgi:hypothetical protein
VDVVAGAHDDPTMVPPGEWGRAQVIPVSMRWWLTNRDGVRAFGPITLFDFRHTLPTKRLFWDVYAPGTYQNFPATGFVRSTLVGRYLFHIARFNSDVLQNGHYELTIEAADICGNTGRLTTSVEIDNG